MTIDEMIEFLESYKNSNIMSDKSRWAIAERRQFDQIIAALKAGQNLSIEARKFGEFAECGGDEDLINALWCWDEATREGE